MKWNQKINYTVESHGNLFQNVKDTISNIEDQTHSIFTHRRGNRNNTLNMKKVENSLMDDRND